MSDPERLIDDEALSLAERQALDAARGEAPPAELVSEAWAALSALPPVGGAAAGTAPTAGATGSLGGSAAAGAGKLGSLVALKALAIGGLVGGTITAGATLWPTAPAPAATAPVAVVSEPARGHSPETTRPPVEPPRAAMPVDVPADAPAAPRAATSTQSGVANRGVAPFPDGAERGESSPSPSSPAAGAATESFPGVAVDPARIEAALVSRARGALRAGDAEGALAVLDAARERFPDGIVRQEREALAIEALVKLGRADDAAARARSFLQAYPTSPHAARVRALVATP